MPLSTMSRVKTPKDCITFIDEISANAARYGFGWWVHNALENHTSEAHKAVNMRHMERAIKLGLQIENDIDKWLEPPPQPPAQTLDMNVHGTPDGRAAGADNTPATTYKTYSKMPPSVSSLYTNGQIERWCHAEVEAHTSTSFGSDLIGIPQKCGTLALRKLATIYAPKTEAAETIATRHYDDQLRVLSKEMPLPELFQNVKDLARIVRYYNPTAVSTRKVLSDIKRAIIVCFGDGAMITSQLAKFDPDHANFQQDPEHRAISMQALLVQYDLEHGPATNQTQSYAFQTSSSDASAIWKAASGGAATRAGAGARPGNHGPMHRQAIPRPGAAATAAACCPWCMTFLERAYNHTYEACNNKKKPALLESLRKQGKLQGDVAVVANLVNHVGSAKPESICAVCFQDHPGGTPACGYLPGIHELVQRHIAASAQDASTQASSAPAVAPAAGDLRALLNASRKQARTLLSGGMRHDPDDRVYATNKKDTRKRLAHRGTHGSMKRKGDMDADERPLRTDELAFKVPKFRHKNEITRHNEFSTLVHCHLARAFDVLAAIQEVAAEGGTDSMRVPMRVPPDWPGEPPDPFVFTETDSASDRQMIGIPDGDGESPSDGDGESLRQTLGISDGSDASDSEDVMASKASTVPTLFSAPNKLDHYYSESFAQIDTGATKTVSSRLDIFHPHSLLPTQTRIQVADGRDIGGVVHSGTLRPNSGFSGLKALYADKIKGTLISQPQAVREQNLAFIHTPNECFAQPFTPGTCPICAPTPGRIHFLVRNSKILLPLPPRRGAAVTRPASHY